MNEERYRALESDLAICQAQAVKPYVQTCPDVIDFNIKPWAIGGLITGLLAGLFVSRL